MMNVYKEIIEAQIKRNSLVIIGRSINDKLILVFSDIKNENYGVQVDSKVYCKAVLSLDAAMLMAWELCGCNYD